MGKYDFSSVCKAWITENGNDYAKIRVESYWKNNAWTYHMHPVYGYTYCNGSEVCVYNAGYPDFRGDQYGQYLLGTHDYTITKNHGTQNINCQARCRSESSYVSGDKWSGVIGVSVGARTSYTVSYNANGGSGAPGKQTKWYNENLTLSNSRPTRTGYSFTGWSGGYQPGQTYSGNANLNLTAQWKANTYTVSYNANGGSGAPGKQTKTYGVTLKLSSTKPTRTNYNFKGWATSPNGGVVYQPGGSYTNNGAITLYAVWELAYTAPRISGVSVRRCTSDGTGSETGTYVKVSFSWATDKTVTGIKILYKAQTSSSWTTVTVSSSGTSGNVSKIIGNNNINTDTTYSFKVTVSDNTGSTSSSEITLGTVQYPIDIKSKGKGVAIGKAAEIDDLFDVGFKSRFRKKVNADQGITVVTLNGGTGTSGYMHACTITINSTYANQHMLFKVVQRGRSGNIILGFSNSNSKDPSLSIFAKTGTINAYIVKTTTSIWNLYIQKAEGYDNIEIVEFNKGAYMNDVTVSWVNSTVTSVPSGYTTASRYRTKSLTSKSHSNWGTNNDYYPDMSFIAYWNGAYNSGNQSNLTYCHQGIIQAKPKVLYNNDEGSNGTITLSESAANFKLLKILYRDDWAQSKSEDVYNPNGKVAQLMGCRIPKSGNSAFMRYKTVTINGTRIYINDSNNDVGIWSSWNNGCAWDNFIYIRQVLGYKI